MRTRTKAIITVALGAGGIAVGILLGAGSDIMAVALLGLLVLVVSFLNPKATVYLIFFMSIIYYDLVRLYFPALEPTKNILDILIIAYFARVTVDRARARDFHPTPALVFAVAWLVFVAAGSLINNIPVMSFLMKTRKMSMFALLFFALANSGMAVKEIKRLIYYVYALVWVNIPVAYWQFYIYKRATDNVKGLTPGGPELTYAIFWLLAMSYGLYLYTKRINLALMVLVAGGLLIVPFMSGIRASFFLYPSLAVLFVVIPLILAYISKGNVLRPIKKAGAALLATGAALFASVLLVPQVRALYEDVYRTFVWGMHFQTRLYSAEHVGRMVAPKIAHAYLAVKGLPALLGGYGLGSIVLTKFTEFAAKQTSFSALTSQLSVSMYEMGYLGVALYAAMALAAAWFVIPGFKNARDDLERAFAFSVTIPVVMFFALTLYYWVWVEHIAGTLFWGLLGLLAGLCYARKKEEVL